ncbi:MAG: peptide chain release factor 1 [candidate division Zixibacteria bacterium]|nr:peptide chain release factor 1 [candidate division Zixibacteria bacterium]
MIDLLDKIDERYDNLSTELSKPEVLKNQDKLKVLGREHRQLEEVKKVGDEYRKVLTDTIEAREIISANEDADLVEMAQMELSENEPRQEKLESKLKVLLLPRDPNDAKDVVVEIRAGTGGDEAALFAADLYRMYKHFAENQGWKVETLSTNPTGIGGLKEIIFSIAGEGAYSRLKFESGVHRVQRVPSTESSGRIHTSAASVAVLPEAEEVELEIKENELKVDVYRSSGPGGQSVNTTDSAVRLTHLPTGLVVTCQDEKSQLKNKTKAMKVLRARLLDQAIHEQQSKIAAERKSMIGSGDRSAKIRTYNFPQGRVTDHRINLTLYKLQVILEGDIKELIDAIGQREQENQLAAAGMD